MRIAVVFRKEKFALFLFSKFKFETPYPRSLNRSLISWISVGAALSVLDR